MKNQQLKNLFLSNTEKTEVHITSDGNKFWDRTHAVNHANTLEDKNVSTISRAEALRAESDEDRQEEILKRKEEIAAEIEKFKPEWDELEAEEKEIAERLLANQEGGDNNSKTGGDTDPPVDPEAGKTEPPVDPDAGKTDPPVDPDAGKQDGNPDTGKTDEGADTKGTKSNKSGKK